MKWALAWTSVSLLYLLILQRGYAAPIGTDREKTLMFLKNLWVIGAGKADIIELQSPTGVEESLECEACKVFSNLLEIFLEQNSPEEDVAKLIKVICIVEKIEDENVCNSIVEEFKQEVLTVAYTISLGRAKQLCAILLGPTCQARYDPTNQTAWDIPVPGNKPPVQPIPDPEPGSPTNRILHLSDIHWDQNYTVGLSKDCGEPICCRPPNKPETGPLAAEKYGEVTCDLANSTLQNLMQFLSGIQDRFDWIYVTGDLPAHNVWNQSRSDQLFILRTITNLIKKYLPTKKCFFTFGNHESAPVNSFPPPWVVGEQSLDWLLNAAVDAWGDWLSQDSINNLLRGGFYNEKIRDGLRVISLQTNYANSLNYWLFINDTDPAGQLSWLVEQLEEAEKAGDKVHIIGHIPPSGFTHSFGWNYHKIVNRFETTIAGQFFGHTHQDEFEVFFDEANSTRATSIAYIGPSVTPSGANPGFRIYTLDGDYDGSSNVVLNYTSYYFNLTNANLKDTTAWLFEYSAKEDYSMPKLHPSDWAELVERFESDDALFQKYYRYRYKLKPPSSTCEGSCKAGILCSMLTSRTGDHSKCSKFLSDDITFSDMQREMNRNRGDC